MEAMTDVLFYKDKISTTAIIEGFKNILNSPAVGDEVVSHPMPKDRGL